tara:strand:+ start:1812 stop:2675 length:864 start_codon:yes stop_codon:yes gene_type:complete
MNILVTGGNSPLGIFFIKRLLNTFVDCSILALSRTELGIKDKRLESLYFDLVNDRFNIDKEFDVVIHAAASVPNSMKNLSELSAVNLEGSTKLFERIKFSNNSLVLNISSSSVYDDPTTNILFEYSQKTSINHYGLSKLNFENALTDIFVSTTVNLLSLRLAVVLVKDVKYNFMSQWLKSIKSGEPIELSHPNALFNACIYSEDIFQFFLKYIKQPITKHLICNLSCKHPIKVIDAAKLMMKTLNSSVPIIEKKSDKKAQLISFDLASKNGFIPRSVEDSIRLYISE